MRIRTSCLIIPALALATLMGCKQSGACEYDNKNGVWVCSDDTQKEFCKGERFTADATCKGLGYTQDDHTWVKK